MFDKGYIYDTIQVLETLKHFYDMGIYERVCSNYSVLCGDDYYEIILNALSQVAPIYDRFQITLDDKDKWIKVPRENMGFIDYWNDVCMFSSPEMQEYHDLCYLYESKHSVTPEENPFAVRAEKHFVKCLRSTSCYFAASYDDDAHPRHLWMEWNEDSYSPGLELIDCVHDTLQFYNENIAELRLELLKTGFPCLPRLPEKGVSNA